MPKTCGVCAHPHREQIDVAIVNNVSVRTIASQFGASRSAVGRHRKTCHRAIVVGVLENSPAAEQLEATKQTGSPKAEVTSITRADDMFRRCRAGAIQAMKRGDLKTGFMGAREARGYLDLLARLKGEDAREERQQAPMFALPIGANVQVTVNQQFDCAGRNVTREEAQEREFREERERREEREERHELRLLECAVQPANESEE